MKNLFTTLFVLTSLITAYSQDTLHVPANYASIQEAIDAAINGDVVLVDTGTYYENINFKGKAITVASHFLIESNETHINNTIIDGSQPVNPDSGSVVVFVSGEDTTSILCGFTITGGSGTYNTLYQGRQGGGIFCENSGCKILNNKIVDNTANGIFGSGGGFATWPLYGTSYVVLRKNLITHNTITASTDIAIGGGIDVWCNGEITDNIISYNECYSNDNQALGGGIDCYGDLANLRELIIKNNTITHNSVSSDASTSNIESYGGGIRIHGYLATVQHNVITHNTLSASAGEGAGGGIWIRQVTDETIIDANLISDNKILDGVGLGGGLAMDEANPKIINNIITQNIATNGGAIRLAFSSSPEMINNTITGNEASELGGGIYVSTNSNPLVKNSILWGDTASSQGNEIYLISGGNISVTYSDVQAGTGEPWFGTGCIDTNPLFSDTLFHLSDASPCIGKGMTPCPPYDFYDNPRPLPTGSMPDIGACESPLDSPVTVSYDLSQIPNEYSLAQNYPNPFNPTTAIKFEIPDLSFVSLKVYDVLGNEIVTLVNSERPVGIYKVEFNAIGLPSGIYFYQLQAGSYIKTNKMVLIK